jgi:hypothetical protein
MEPSTVMQTPIPRISLVDGTTAGYNYSNFRFKASWRLEKYWANYVSMLAEAIFVREI